MTDPAHPAEALLGRARAARVRVLLGAALLAGFLVVAHLTSLHERASAYLDAARGLGARGVLVHAALYLVAALLALPASPITVLAGATYGVLAGAALAVPCVTAAACAAFLVGRLVVARDPEALAQGEGKIARAVRAIGHGGFRLVVVLRLAPVAPFSVLNFAFGATPMPLARFALGSFVGTIPSQLGYALLGDAFAWAPGRPRDVAEAAVLAAGVALSLVAGAVAAVLLRRLAREQR